MIGRRWIAATVIGVGLACFSLFLAPQKRLIWNRTASAPQGLYWLSDGPHTAGRWAVVSSQSGEAQWANAHGFTGEGWPLIKQISGVSGDTICRNGAQISINGKPVADALLTDNARKNLPAWSGCFVLKDDEVFLLNAHPRSLDGRYFGPSSVDDLDGVAVLIFEWKGA